MAPHSRSDPPAYQMELPSHVTANHTTIDARPKLKQLSKLKRGWKPCVSFMCSCVGLSILTALILTFWAWLGYYIYVLIKAEKDGYY